MYYLNTNAPVILFEEVRNLVFHKESVILIEE